MTEGMQGALLSSGTTVLAALIGFGSVLHQIRSQARISRDLERENHRTSLKLEVYQEISACVGAASDKVSSFIAVAENLKLRLKLAQFAPLFHENDRDNLRRVMDTAAAIGIAQSELMICLEKWVCIDGRLRLFHAAAGAATYDFRKAFDGFLASAFVYVGPNQADAQGPIWTSELAAQAAHLHDLLEVACNRVYDISSYLHDTQVELQTLLVANLFEGKVERRVPLDPASRVLKLETAESQTKWFREQSEWGLECKRQEAETAARFGTPTEKPPAT